MYYIYNIKTDSNSYPMYGRLVVSNDTNYICKFIIELLFLFLFSSSFYITSYFTSDA